MMQKVMYLTLKLVYLTQMPRGSMSGFHAIIMIVGCGRVWQIVVADIWTLVMNVGRGGIPNTLDGGVVVKV